MPQAKPFDPPATESPPVPLPSLSNPSIPSIDDAADLGRIFSILGDPRGKKAQVLYLLCGERLSVRELAERMSWNIGGLSQWLTRLHLAGIVVSEQDGHKKIYRLTDGVIVQIANRLNKVFNTGDGTNGRTEV